MDYPMLHIISISRLLGFKLALFIEHVYVSACGLNTTQDGSGRIFHGYSTP
jgi:hypothetical protein